MTCIAPRCLSPRELGSVFCATHLIAPAVRRGGWLSAWQRRRKMTATPPEAPPLDMSNITPRLWVGAAPPFDRDLPEFDVLVLCAAEIQPAVIAFERKIIRVPMPDGVLSTDELRRALIAARAVAEALTQGQRVLVTCAAGINRSALVAALALGLITHMDAAQIIALIRQRRTPGATPENQALRNPHFCELITKFVGQRQAQWRSSVAQAARRRPR